MKVRSAFSGPTSDASPPQPWPGRGSISPWLVSPRQPLAFHWSIWGFRACRDRIARISSGVWIRISGTWASAAEGPSAASTRSASRLCGFLGALAGSGVGAGFSGLRTRSSFRVAAPSILSCGKVTLTVTGMQAAARPTRPSSARSGRMAGMTRLLTVEDPDRPRRDVAPAHGTAGSLLPHPLPVVELHPVVRPGALLAGLRERVLHARDVARRDLVLLHERVVD